MLELNRMAFDDVLPKNSESRAISIAMKLIKRNAPHIKWVLSFADGTQCGDGTIYRASGFYLIKIKESKNLVRRSDGVVIHKMTLESSPTTPRLELNGQSYYDITQGKYDFNAYVRATNGIIIPGYQLCYIYLIDKTAKITVPILPFSEITKRGASMYKGQPRVTSIDSDASGNQSEEGGASPTVTLHESK